MELETGEDAKVATFTLTYDEGAQSGWHRHPGIVIATVEKGVVTRSVGCKTVRFSQGQSFTEVEPHLVANAAGVGAEGEQAAVLRITHVYPADVHPIRRTDVPPPAC